MYLYICFWLCWVSVAVWVFLWLQCSGSSLQWLLLLWSAGSRGAGLCSVVRGRGSYGSQALSTGSVVGAHGFTCPLACRISLDQGSNPCLLHWQAGSLPLYHQGSPLHPSLSVLIPNISLLQSLICSQPRGFGDSAMFQTWPLSASRKYTENSWDWQTLW